jgi:hypothetical protein
MVPMNPKTVWLCLGLLGGTLLTLGVQYALQRPEEPARAATPRPAAPREDLRAELDLARADLAREQARSAQLAKEVEELRAAPRPPAPAGEEGASGAKPAPPAGVPTDDEVLAAVREFGNSLGSIIQGRGDEAKEKIRELFERAGKPAVEMLLAKFEDDTNDIGTRIFIAHALAQSGNADAIAALSAIVEDPQAAMIELRLASNGLAFSDAEGIETVLIEAAHRAPDLGARANSSFGLARRKNPEGLALYAKAVDEAMANGDPAALQYLSGFTLLGDEGLPPMRERLLTYTEPQALLTLIEILKGRGDKGATANLERLAADEGRPASVRKAAAGALKAIGAGE